MYDTKTLEFDKIIDKLKDFAKTNYAKSKIINYKLGESFEEIKDMLNETKEAYDNIIKLQDIPLGGLFDVNEPIKRATLQGILTPGELLNIVGLIDSSNNVIRYFKELDGIKLDETYLLKYVNEIEIPKTLKNNILLAISDDGNILDNASRELFVIRRSLKSLENRLRSKLNELLQTHSSMLTDNIIVIRDGRMCLPVNITYKNSFKGIIHDVSSSNTTCYIEPASTLEIANQIDNYIEQEKKEIQVILKNLSLLVSAEADILMKNLEALTELDIIYAKALMGKEYDYYIPKFVDETSFNLKNVKHPLIDRNVVVPIDCNLGTKNQVIVITGPNTGGKTVALKTVGLNHLMVYYGMMVPCSNESTFGYFSDILADIGDEQSIEQSLSTFSSHMKKICNIVSQVTFKSLILLDELGSGTDPKEGSSIAMAIITYLKNCGAKLMVTTHYSELKNYSYETEGVINASVEFDIDSLKPTYRLLMGVSGKSMALVIASKLGLDDKIINLANSNLSNMNSDSSRLIGNLEEEMEKTREETRKLEEEKKNYLKLIDDLNREKTELVKKTDKIIYDAKQNANKIILEAKEEASKLIDEIKNLSDENFKEHELAELKRKTRNLDVEAEEESLFNDQLNVGDFVYIKTYQKYGTINKIKGDKYYVNIGQFNMDFKRSELQLSAKPVEKPKKQTRMSGYNPSSHVGLSLDLRGKRYDEVKRLMDDYLDQAILGNLEQVTIIHGFGTGAVRNAVQEYLKNSPIVKKYRYGGEGEGLNGVTIVYLK